MTDKIITAEEIYALIENKEISKELGINLIHNYGLRKQREFMEKLKEEYSGNSIEIEGRIKIMSEKLDELLNKIMEAYI